VPAPQVVDQVKHGKSDKILAKVAADESLAKEVDRRREVGSRKKLDGVPSPASCRATSTRRERSHKTRSDSTWRRWSRWSSTCRARPTGKRMMRGTSTSVALCPFWLRCLVQVRE
jgi:hypothetical protein